MRLFDAIPRRGATLLVLLSLSGTGAQVAPPPPTNQTTRTPVLPGNGRNGQDEDENNPLARQMSEQQAIRRNNQRQQQIVDDTAKLVHLAQHLKEEMDQGKLENPGKTVDEIEKLAKSVKEKMKEAQ